MSVLSMIPTTEDRFYLRCFDGEWEIEISGLGGKRAKILYRGELVSDIKKISITCEAGSIPIIEIRKYAGLST